MTLHFYISQISLDPAMSLIARNLKGEH